MTPPAAPLRLDVVADPAAIEATWRGLAAEGVAVPFQGFDWVAAFLAAGALPKGARPLLLRGRRDEAVDLLLPLVVERRGPLAVARRLGGSHASYVLGVWSQAGFADLAPAELESELVRIGRAEGIDAFAFDAVPVAWDGRSTPLARIGTVRPALDDGHAFRLAASFDALIAGRNAGHKRKKLKAKERLLEAAGGHRVAVAADEPAVEAALAAYFAQKGASLAARGISDPFADPKVRDAYRRLALLSLGRAEPPLELTVLEAGGRIRAVIGASIRADRLYALFVSHADDELARASPGETLFFRHIERACGRGLAVYDMGLGSERYKASWCDERVALVDVRLAVTLAGRAVLAAEGLVGRAKAAIRRDERLWGVVKRLRARLAGRTTAGEGGRDPD